jgi:hypothetical protein
MQAQDANTTDYIERLKDEELLLELADVIKAYYIKVDKPAAAARIAAMQVEHLYYKHSSIETTRAADKQLDAPDMKNVIHKLALHVYRDSTDDRLKTRTMLCQVRALLEPPPVIVCRTSAPPCVVRREVLTPKDDWRRSTTTPCTGAFTWRATCC